MRIGEAFIYGRGKARARAILAAANTVGVDFRAVRTTDNGFLVPAEVADEFNRQHEQHEPTWVKQDAVF